MNNWTYEIDGYPRANQKPASGCTLTNTYKNHDSADTWGGTLKGAKEAIAKTLVAWGMPEAVVKLHKISYRDALKEVEESGNEDDLGESRVSESRPSRTLDLLSEFMKVPMVEKLVRSHGMADGVVALLRTVDGNAYEVQIRPAAYGKTDVVPRSESLASRLLSGVE